MAFKRALVVLNPEAGGASRRSVEEVLEREAGGIAHQVRRLGVNDEVEKVTLEELASGWDVVVAAGGDGTVSGVARAARMFGTPVAILPLGTGNILADQLRIPGDINEAVRLLKGNWAIRRIDGIEIGERLYLLNAGMGLSASTVRDVRGDDKKRFGLSAYVWTGLARSFTFRPIRCTVTVDGRSRRLRVLDVSIMNAGFRADRPVPGMPEIRPDDGLLNVLIVWAPRPLEYLRHLERALFRMSGLNANIQWKTAKHEVRIACAEKMPVQADGDLIGETPVVVRVVPGAVDIVVPADRAGDATARQGEAER